MTICGQCFLDLTGGYVDNSPGMYEIAHEKAQELVDNYQSTVPEKVSKAIRRFFKNKYQSREVVDIGW